MMDISKLKIEGYSLDTSISVCNNGVSYLKDGEDDFWVDIIPDANNSSSTDEFYIILYYSRCELIKAEVFSDMGEISKGREDNLSKWISSSMPGEMKD